MISGVGYWYVRDNQPATERTRMPGKTRVAAWCDYAGWYVAAVSVKRDQFQSELALWPDGLYIYIYIYGLNPLPNSFPNPLPHFLLMITTLDVTMLFFYGFLVLLDMLVPPQILGVTATTPEVSIPCDPSFDINRIQDYPDQLLSPRLSKYIISFTTEDFNGMNDLQSDELPPHWYP